MKKDILLKGLVPTLVLFSTQAAALPFQSIDPRSFAMGGVGVASGTSANAGFMNPALLAAAKDDEDFSLEFPIIGARIHDPDNLIDEINAYQDNNLEGNLTSAIDTFKADTTAAAAASAVGDAATAILTQLQKLSNKPIQGEVFAGMVVGVPSKKVGASLNLSGYAVGGGLFDLKSADTSLINGIISDAATSPAALASNTAVADQISNTQNVVDKLQSGLDARGALITEVGLSLAHEFNIAGHNVAVGITPKAVKVKTFDYFLDANTAKFDANTGTKDYNDVNLDVGLAKDYGNGWKAGLVAKNLIAHDYQTVLGHTVKIEPQLRAGVSRSNDWLTLAADLDLKENQPAGFDSKTQYLAVGAELDLFDWVQFRAGYRHNLSDTNTSIPTIGFGFSPFGVHIDVAYAQNNTEKAASLQLGFRF